MAEPTPEELQARWAAGLERQRLESERIAAEQAALNQAALQQAAVAAEAKRQADNVAYEASVRQDMTKPVPGSIAWEEQMKKVSAGQPIDPPPGPVPAPPPAVAGMSQQDLDGLKAANPTAYQALTGTPNTMAPTQRDMRTAAPPATPHPMGGPGGPRGPAPSPWMSTISPDARAAFDEGLGQARHSIDMREALGEKQAHETAGVMQQQEQLAEQAAQRFADQKTKQAEQAALVEQKFANAVDALDHTEIDNDRWFAKQGTGQKLVTTMAVLLGGLASGMKSAVGSNPTGGNTGVDILNSQMAADIAQQRDMYNRKKDKAAGIQTLYGQMMRRFGDEDQAFSAAMALGSQKLATRLKTLDAARGSDDAKVRAEEMLAKLNEQRGQYISQTYKLRPTGGGGGTKKLQNKLDELRMANMAGLEKEQMMKQLGLGEYAKAGQEDIKDVRKDVRDLSAAIVHAELPKFETTLTRAEEAFAKAGDEGMNPLSQGIYTKGGVLGRMAFEAVHGKSATERQQAMQTLVNAQYKEQGGAAISAGEDKRYQAALAAGDYEGAIRSLQALRSGSQATRGAIESGYDPRVVNSYHGRETGRVNSAKGDK